MQISIPKEKVIFYLEKGVEKQFIKRKDIWRQKGRLQCTETSVADGYLRKLQW